MFSVLLRSHSAAKQRRNGGTLLHEYFMKLMYFVSVVLSIAILQRRPAAKRLGAILLHTLLIQRIGKPKRSRYTLPFIYIYTYPHYKSPRDNAKSV